MTDNISNALWTSLNRGQEVKLRSWGNDELWYGVSESGDWFVEIRMLLPVRVEPDSPAAFKYLTVSPLEPISRCNRVALTFHPESGDARSIWVHLVEDILGALQKALKARYKGLFSTLAKWEDFWPVEKPSGITAQLLQGLFGELWMLKWFMDAGLPAIRAWPGPDRSPHDFHFPRCHVEVKTCGRNNREVTIRSLRQLDDSGLDYLFLCCVRLMKTNAPNDSLAVLEENIRNRLSDDEQRFFDRGLRKARWFQIPEKLREESRFHVLRHNFYHVTHDFPRLLEEPKGNIPSAITVREYRLEIPSSTGEFGKSAVEVIAAIAASIGEK